MLGFCPHTKRLVGYAHDAFDLDVICSEFKRKYKKEEEGDATELGDTNCDDGEVEDTGAKCDDLKLGKHYMVFMAQSITSKGRPMSFMAARYCLSSLNGRWVRINKRQITSTLAYFLFPVILNSFDGASENGAAMVQDLTLSLRNLLPELSSKYEIHDLPWEMKIAYNHPTLPDKVIAAAADMPHGVKKQVNAVELSGKPKSKRDLHLNGLPVQLRMAFDVYTECDKLYLLTRGIWQQLL